MHFIDLLQRPSKSLPTNTWEYKEINALISPRGSKRCVNSCISGSKRMLILLRQQNESGWKGIKSAKCLMNDSMFKRANISTGLSRMKMLRSLRLARSEGFWFFSISFSLSPSMHLAAVKVFEIAKRTSFTWGKDVILKVEWGRLPLVRREEKNESSIAALEWKKKEGDSTRLQLSSEWWRIRPT